MKNDLYLVITGLICACLAWVFWHFLGADAFSVMSTLALLLVSADNFRLRRQLKAAAELT